jgi:hypothetical protein
MLELEQPATDVMRHFTKKRLDTLPGLWMQDRFVLKTAPLLLNSKDKLITKIFFKFSVKFQ